MFDPERMLGQMLGGALGGAFGGTRGAKSLKRTFGGNTAMKAQVGLGLLGVAFAAYEHYQQQRGGFAGGAAQPQSLPPSGSAMPPPPPPAGPGASAMPPPPPPAAASHVANADARLLMQAMIAAAAADGRIDDDERARVIGRAEAVSVDTDGRRFLEAELAAPKSVETIAAATRRELAADVYAASALAISLDTAEERAYLDRLARALDLGDAQRAEIHTRLGLA